MEPLHARNSQNHHHDAFVLVIALALMAFVLLLILSMATLIEVEAQAASTGLHTLRAHENARLSLMLAIGELQKHVGSDQRVTARADILGDGNFNSAARFWTGVWDTANPTLLSYQFDDPATAITHWQAAQSDNATQSLELAQKTLVMNRFNLNSTSVAAWKAVLGGLRIKDWEYLDYPKETSDLSMLTVKQDTRARMFTRFSQSLSETYKAPQTPVLEGADPVAPSAYYRRGARYFDANEIESLSKEIVRLIKTKGTPFLSMEAFLSEQSPGSGSLIEQAIATVFAPTGRQQWNHQWETEGIRESGSETIDIDHFSPGFLTQADVITAIGPMLAPRSDTFKIRARGQSFSQQGNPTGSATIEATLQRTPEVIDPTTAINQSTERKIRLISLRWLADKEI